MKRAHWAFQPVQRAPPPTPRSSRLSRTPIDAFILDRLEREGLTPSPPADPRTLIRRLYFDLLGLPPTPEAVAAFERDRRPEAYDRLVDELLASPHYGERWARHWLDVVRYAETHGFEMNQPRPNSWPYRDYVIRAFNEDRPYDRFVLEQLAGDALGMDEATGFLVAGAWDQVKSPDVTLTSNQRADELHDMISVTGTAFLGLTLGCARCHEHKFDPIPQRDYYALKAVFEGVQHGERKLRTAESLAREQQAAAHRDALARLEEQLAGFVAPASPRRTIFLDEETPSSTNEALPHVLELVKHTARGEYRPGMGRGERDDPGELDRPPNPTPAYLAWSAVSGADVFAWAPRATGHFQVFLSWGCGWRTHATDARFLLDRDGDLGTRDDQVEIARVNQQKFADGTGEVPDRPLWSGFYDAGAWEITPASRIVLRGGATDAYVSADLLVLQEAPPADQSGPAIASANGAQPALRPAVNPRQNLDRFPPLRTRRVRFTILATSGAEPCLDELEIYTAGASSTNVALATAGAKATASGTFPNNELHKLEHLTDGRYGNSRSWISNEPGKGWVELEFPAPVEIDRVVWGRDREGKFSDRLAVEYVLEAQPEQGGWRTLARSDDRLPYAPGRASSPAFGLAAVGPDAKARLRELLTERAAHNAKLRELSPAPLVYGGEFKQPAATRRFHRGDPMQPREEVAPGVLSEIGGDSPFAPGASSLPEQQRRLALAHWIADPANPLTARVIVNRLWQHHFGEGLVTTPSDFGANGARPTHPELLDWLASELMTHQWRLKHIQRLIVTSAAYRQASSSAAERGGPGARAAALDAGARLLWRFPPRRLEAEPIRDAILAVSGKLDERAGGPGWSPFEPNENYVRVYLPKREFGAEDLRRMVYATVVRQRPDGVFGAFDCPDGGQIAPRRTRSTTPLQSLNLLNSGFIMQAAGFFAQRLQRDAGASPEAQVRRAFALAFNRAPAREELEAGVKFIRAQDLRLFCRALLNSNEFVFVF
jgi:hypothetical protein